MFTRTLTAYKATAYTAKTDFKTKKAEFVELGTVEFLGTSPSKTDIRKAFAENGISVPKGTEFDLVEIEKATYGCTMEEFLEIAQKIEVIDNEQ